MERLGFTRDDLAVFGVESLDARQRALDERLRPRLEAIAYRFAPGLSRLAGQPLAAAINLPSPGTVLPAATASFLPVGVTNVSLPYFTFSITRGGVHARLVVDTQAEARDKLAKKVGRAAAALAKELGESNLRCYDEWDGQGVPAIASAGKAPFWKELAERLSRQDGCLDIGVGWPEARAVLLSYEDLLPAYRALVPIYKRLAA